MVNNPLIRPYFLGGGVALGGGVPLDSHDLGAPGHCARSREKPRHLESKEPSELARKRRLRFKV